ncbi:MAG TPA: DNA translocase FtsK 4TM domain-containing protein [Gemmatimonadota bacterium]|nr:DNA translocase FtsK 4TM domain-containing protein [Gemmatimonadota bacterium]
MAQRRKPDSARLRREILGLLMAATGGFLLVALWPYDPAAERSLATLNRVGIAGSYSAFYLYRWLGYGALVAGLLLLAWGALVFFDRLNRRFVAVSGAAVAATGVVLVLLGLGGVWTGAPGPWAVRAGWTGRAAASALIGTVGMAGAFLTCAVTLAVLAVATFKVSLARGVEAGARAGFRAATARRARERSAIPSPGGAPPLGPEGRVAAAGGETPTPSSPVSGTPSAEAPSRSGAAARRAGTARATGVARAAGMAGADGAAPTGFLPPLEILDPLPVRDGERTRGDLERLGQVLIEKLRSFNVEGEIVAIHGGPVLTQFEVEPAPGVKVNQIANLADDLALAMRAQRIRIVAPIPGKGAVGIEVPNPEPQQVTVREILESRAWSGTRARLPLALGREIAGAPIVSDLARMPHLLIAGATGSGKSVCINSIVTSLLYRFGPEEVRLIMIDPKMLELITYNGIPHLLHPVVVEHKQSAKALKWTVAEMEQRYRLLAANGVRSLQDFNARARDGGRGEGASLDAAPLKGLDGTGEPPRPLPFIVLLIDELADLILTVQAEIEEPLARLAQMARAVGIHLVLATQRPSVNVITGVIKANFPSRISFQVSSKIDSRTVLDMNGAEQLLGNGDMLYMPADRAEPIRIQGAFVSTAETGRIVEYLRRAGEALNAEAVAPQVDIIAEMSDLEMAALDEKDELFVAAARVVVEHDQGSTSLLQRRLKIGYSRAARILDQLERAGIVGPPEGTKPREVLVTLDDLEPLERASP